MKTIFNRLLLLILWVASTTIKCSGSGKSEITTEELQEYLEYLASDELKGRRAGSDEAFESARYIANLFKQSGLELLGEDGMQYYDIVVDLKYGDSNKLSFDDVEYTMGNDFNPFSYSANGELNANVVFMGFGFDIDTEEMVWNSYQDMDVENKWVMILRGDPEPEKDEDLFINYSGDRGKVLIAKDHGAAGVIFVSGSEYDEKDKLVSLYFDKTQSNAGMPVIQVKRDVADTILKKNKVTTDQLTKEIMELWSLFPLILNNSYMPELI